MCPARSGRSQTQRVYATIYKPRHYLIEDCQRPENFEPSKKKIGGSVIMEALREKFSNRQDGSSVPLLDPRVRNCVGKTHGRAALANPALILNPQGLQDSTIIDETIWRQGGETDRMKKLMSTMEVRIWTPFAARDYLITLLDPSCGLRP